MNVKANAVFNQSLFRQFDGSTESISSSVMIFHPIKEPGSYEGTVLKNDLEVGGFIVECGENNTQDQADIDLSGFTPALSPAAECCADKTKKTYRIKKEGYVLFHASKGEDGFSVLLSPSSFTRERTSYFTKKPESGDIVLIMLVRPGVYQLISADKKACMVSVEMPRSTREFQQFLQQPVTITYSDKGFEKDAISLVPGQGLVVHLEFGTSLFVKLVKPQEVSPDIEEDKTKFRWEKPHSPHPDQNRKKKK